MKEAEKCASKLCCTDCKAVICKEKCECWTFAKKGVEFGYNKANEWHKVANGDYPPYDKGNYTINVFTNSGRIAYYNYDDECWIEVFSGIEINPPIAWCEIPKFEE